MMNQETENEIIQRVLNGDRDAYAPLVDEYKGPIFNLAYRMTGNYQNAEDLAQETFVRAYKALRRFNRKKRFFPWLYTITLNLIRNHLVKKRVAPYGTYIEPDCVIPQDDKQDPEQNAVRQQEIEKLNFCLQKIPLDLKEAVILRFYQGLSFKDIAEISGISLSAVKMRVYRALDKLRESMKEQTGEQDRRL